MGTPDMIRCPGCALVFDRRSVGEKVSRQEVAEALEELAEQVDRHGFMALHTTEALSPDGRLVCGTVARLLGGMADHFRDGREPRVPEEE